MADYLVKCECGAENAVSEWAIGAPLRCKSCKRPLEPTDTNTRLVEEPKKETRRPRESDLPMSPEGRLYARREHAGPAPVKKASSSPAPIVPAPPPAPGIPEEPEPAAPPVRATNCARCGREFRGDWDRYHRSSGVVCHICANLAPAKDAEDEAVAPAAQAPAFGGVEYKGVLDHPILPQQDDSPADHAERQARMRRWVLLAAVVTLALVVLVVVTDDTPLPTPNTGSAAAQDAPKLPPWATVAVILTLFVFRSFSLGGALYMALHWRDRLPSDFILANIITLGAWALGLQVLHIAMNVVPLGGLLWIGVCIYILWDQFDLSPTDFLLIALFLFLLEPLSMVLQAFALAAIGFFAL